MMNPTELANLIKERIACNNARSLLNQFKPIVENIFGYSDGSNSEHLNSHINFGDKTKPRGWHLKGLTRSSNINDYESVVSFLHPDGLFFSLIRSLMTETTAKFEFPVSHFPPHFRSMIENGTAPPFFANKIISTTYNAASHLILNPFEYYIFHFGLYILTNNSSSFDMPISSNDEPAYFSLLRIYLEYFVPLDAMGSCLSDNNNQNQQSSIWQSLSNTTSNLLNIASGTNSQTNANMSTTSIGQGSNSLFKASIFQAQSPFNKSLTSNQMNAPGPILYGQGEHIRSIEWRCSTFLLMLTELWFGNIPAPKTNYILRSTNLDDLSISSIQPYSANIDQMTSVRIVIKHLHYFSNSFNYNPVSHAGSQGLAEIKQAIWTSKYPLRKRLYTFIKVAFQRWPMDYTFRQPLEAWLSFIQPWRYTKQGGKNTIIANTNDYEDLDISRGPTLTETSYIDNHWRSFISDNLLYYTSIFSVLIDRLLQLDLSSSRNALMLYRAIKVYSQPGFLTLLREAEEAVMRNNFEISMSKSPYKNSNQNMSSIGSTVVGGGSGLTNRNLNSDMSSSSPSNAKLSAAKSLAPSFLASGQVSSPKSRMGAFEHHLMNLESDTSLFSPQMKQKLTKLLGEVQNSRISIKDYVQCVEVRSKLRNRGWFESLRSLISMEDGFESKDEREMYRDKAQADEYLNFVTYKVVQCFGVQAPELDSNSNTRTQQQQSHGQSQSQQQPNITASQTSNRIFFNV